MTNREQLKREIDTIDETYLEVLHRIIISLKEPRDNDQSSNQIKAEKDKPSEQNSLKENSKSDNSLLSKLKQIQISAPADFSEKIDDYLTGEKNV